MPFGLCNTLATLQRLMQKCLDELNLTYCLIYLDDMIIFSKTEEEHLQCLCIVFECFSEHNLNVKPTKCDFFQNEINYLAHHISKEGVWPSKENLKAVAEIAPPQNLHWNLSFLGAWWGISNDLSRGLHALCNHCMNLYLGKVSARRMSE